MRRLLVGLLCGAAVGCGSGGPFDYVKVSGKVTYEDGSPIPGGILLRFSALEAPAVEGAVPRPALARVDARGEFDCVTSYKYCDGLIPGKHKVAIQVEGVQTGRPVVPKEYSSVATTPLVIDTAERPLEIKVPKPR